MVREGSFREDLYYRLRGATIEVPPLRARPGDVELLIDAFLDEIAARRGGARLAVSKEALRAAASYAWPGNVRELRAEVARWGVFCDRVVEESDLAEEIRQAPLCAPDLPTAREIAPLADVVREAERAAVVQALAAHDGNLSRTARALGIDRNTLKRKITAFAIGR
jgi:DNA-binding NtrC family response regulator